VDAAQVTELRSWATRLEERASNEELRAAAKAIHLLADEVERLQAQLVESEADAPPAAPVPKESPPVTAPAAAEEAAAPDPPWSDADDRLQGSFFSRLKRSLGVG
jgi:hypothetical protein